MLDESIDRFQCGNPSQALSSLLLLMYPAFGHSPSRSCSTVIVLSRTLQCSTRSAYHLFSLAMHRTSPIPFPGGCTSSIPGSPTASYNSDTNPIAPFPVASEPFGPNQNPVIRHASFLSFTRPHRTRDFVILPPSDDDCQRWFSFLARYPPHP